MPDSALSAAIMEAYAAAPVAEVIYHTLEIRHPDFVTPLRVVRDHVSLDATLEAGAPEDASTEVTFLAYPFDIRPPEVSASGSPRLVVEIDNVSRDIVAAIEAAVASTEPVEITYRVFLASDLSGPQNDPPITLTASKITATALRVTLDAGFDDMTNKRFPAAEFTAARFPGLVAQ